MQKIGKSYLLRYSIALLLIASLTTGAFITLYSTISMEEHRAEVVRIASGQIALSQRIAFFANAYAGAKDEIDREDYHREFGKAIRAMERAHHSLLNGSDKLGLAKSYARQLRSLFTDGKSPFNAQVKSFLNNAKTFLGLPEKEVLQGHMSLVSLNLAGMNFIPQGYDLISDILKDQSRKNIHYLEKFEIIVWLTTLTLLVLEAALIFRPLGQRMQAMLKNLEVEKVRAEESAAEAEHAMHTKSRFLMTMSHEIRTPLNAVLGMSSILLETNLTDKQRGFVNLSKSSGEHLLQLINNILDYSKLDAGRLQLEEMQFNLYADISNVVAVLEPGATKKGLTLTQNSTFDPECEFLGDNGRIRQLLLNLIGNAIKFSEQGQITVETCLRGNEKLQAGDKVIAEIKVIDQGLGIDEADISRLFQDFEQVENGTSRRFDGSGLGLAISKRLVELMGGSIGVDSKPGEGSTFWFAIPLIICEAPQQQHTGHEPVAQQAISNQPALNILLAEDNQSNQLIAQVYLDRLGHNVQFAGNGIEAVQLAGTQDFDMIFMDIQMPEMDGITALKQIRNIAGAKGQVPIVAVTAYGIGNMREHFLEEGFDDYIAKPIDPDKLPSLIAKLCETRQIEPEQALKHNPVNPEQAGLPSLIHQGQLDSLLKLADVKELQNILNCALSTLLHALKAMREAKDCHDFNEVRLLGHSMVGTMSNFGANRLTHLLRDLEQTADEDDGLQAKIESLIACGYQTEQELRNKLPETIAMGLTA